MSWGPPQIAAEGKGRGTTAGVSPGCRSSCATTSKPLQLPQGTSETGTMSLPGTQTGVQGDPCVNVKAVRAHEELLSVRETPGAGARQDREGPEEQRCEGARGGPRRARTPQF